MTPTITQSLSERYRPALIDDLVLAPYTAERLLAFRQYLATPRPTAWLLHGDTGAGKTSLARIVVRHFREIFRAQVIEEAGPRIRDEMVEGWHRTFCGPRWFTEEPTLFFIDEADLMTKKAMSSLRSVIEAGYPNNCHWILTSNKPPKAFGPALKSRLQAIPFSDQGLAPRMAARLMQIGQQEGYLLSDKDALAIARASRNDIRAAVNELDALISASRFQANLTQQGAIMSKPQSDAGLNR